MIDSITQMPAIGAKKPAAYQPSRVEATYSPAGKAMAQAAKDFFDKGGMSWETARTSLRDSFTQIQENPQATAAEKALAKMGIAAGEETMPNKDSARMRAAIMNTIAAAAPGPIGAVLSQTGLNVYELTGIKWSSIRVGLRAGLETIRQTPQTAGSEKTLALLGVNFGAHKMPDSDAARVRAEVLKIISEPEEQTSSQAVIKAGLNAYRLGGIQWSSARAILRDGFEAILESPEASETQKQLATAGIKAGSPKMDNQDAAKARYEIMKQLQNLK